MTPCPEEGTQEPMKEQPELKKTRSVLSGKAKGVFQRDWSAQSDTALVSIVFVRVWGKW